MKLWERIKRYEENTPQEIKDRIEKLKDMIPNRQGFPYLDLWYEDEDGHWDKVLKRSVLRGTPPHGERDMNIYGKYYKITEYPFYIIGRFSPTSGRTAVYEDDFVVIERDIEAYIHDLGNAVEIEAARKHFGITKEEE